MNLNMLLDYLTEKNHLMINLHDATGILSLPPFQPEMRFKIHKQNFCDIAKATRTGYRLCTRTKALACAKAINSREYFFGFCPFGLYELVYPVTVEDKVVCILFIGNCLQSTKDASKRINRACAVTGGNCAALSEELKNCEPADKNYMLTTARILADYIQKSIQVEKLNLKIPNKQHWAIAEIKAYADTHFRQQITLKQLSKVYFLNEKYAGRLFLKQTGSTFHKYLNDLRLKAAADLLINTERSVLDIALSCGFNSISYFNRSFSEKFNKTPTAYRTFSSFK